MFLCTESASEDENEKEAESDKVVEDQKEVTAGSNAAAWGSVSMDDPPVVKKPKLHFGGLNLKKKKETTETRNDFADAPDTFDEW